MKRLLVIALFFAAVLPKAAGQTISMIEFKPIPSDLTARTSPRVDLNGEFCALLKIQIQGVDDMQFSGWVIGDVTYKPGEYFVYVPAGTKKIKFHTASSLPGEIEFPQVVESQCTYLVLLTSPNDEEEDEDETFPLMGTVKADCKLAGIPIYVSQEEMPARDDCMQVGDLNVKGTFYVMVPAGYDYILFGNEKKGHKIQRGKRMTIVCKSSSLK